jgi:predicted Zn-dependent protease
MIAPQLSPRGRASTLFATHPPTEDRIARLMEMAGGVEHERRAPVAQQFLERDTVAPAAPTGAPTGPPFGS